jgi:hypothetical protein
MAVADGYGCDCVKIDQAEAELTLHLVKDVPINGRILDPDGRPVAGAKVTVSFVSTVKDDDLAAYVEQRRKDLRYPIAKRLCLGPLPGKSAVVTTGTDGRFHLTGVGRERLVGLRVEGPTIASTGVGTVMTRAAETIVLPGRTTLYGASFDYVGVASRPIRGVVRDKETGKSLAGVSVGLAHGTNRYTPTATADSEGRYELLGLPKSSRYRLLAKPPDGLYFQREVEVQETPGLGVLTCDFELVKGLMVRGRITDREMGKPIARARVDYHPLGGNPNVNKLPGVWRPKAETTTGPDGAYALTVLPGPGVIGVVGPKPDAYMPAFVTAQEQKDFFKASVVRFSNEEFIETAVGSNNFSGIRQANYNAIVLLEPDEKEEVLQKDVALDRPRERKGRVLGPHGQPLTGVTAIGLGLYGLGFNVVETLREAEFTVRGINPRANRSLVFYHRGKNLGCFVKELRGDATEPLTIQLQPCGSVSGRIVDSDDQPVAGLPLARFKYFGGAQQLENEQGLAYTTDTQGRFHLESLVPGLEYHLGTSEASGLPRMFPPVRLEPGEHKDMGDIKLAEEG